MNNTAPLTQNTRPACSLPMADADLSLNNANWTKGLQAMSDWIWSANLNPYAFPNNLGRYLLQIPGIFEQQLNYSTALIFDEPSFKNGVQVSGFVHRVHKELAISMIAQTRRSWYTMTHHAILGKLTADKHGVPVELFANKMYYLGTYTDHTEYYSPLEIKILDFVKAFATDQKAYSDEQMKELREEFRNYNAENYKTIDRPFLEKEAANLAKTEACSKGISLTDPEFSGIAAGYIDRIPAAISDELNEQKVNAQVVELAFLCLQFVALSCVFTGLNIPDESFLAGVMEQQLPAKLIDKINELNELGLDANTPDLLPPAIEDFDIIFKAIQNGKVSVAPAALKGARVPLTPYEGKDSSGQFRPAFTCSTDRDKGVTIGAVQVGVYGWGFGGHFPGSLVYCLMNHPELARFEAPYSLPLLFNEDEWRNGVQTAGYVSRKLKELVIQKVYKCNRSRYGIEHHIMFFYNSFLDEYGVGRITNPNYSAKQSEAARKEALKHAETAAIFIHNHKDAPSGTYSPLEQAILTWTEALVRTPHTAHEKEAGVRRLLAGNNEMEIRCGIRILDTSPGIGDQAALARLADHQIAELAMMIGHMDGLGRLLTILKLEAEDAVQAVAGTYTEQGGIAPALDEHKQVQFTGYFNNRPALHDIWNFIGITDKTKTINELLLNPGLCALIVKQLQADPGKEIKITSIDNGSAEF